MVKLRKHATPASSAGKKRLVLYLMLAGAGALGALIVLYPMAAMAVIPFMVLCYLILAILWCYLDARERGDELGSSETTGLAFLFILFFPLYLVRTRGENSPKTMKAALWFLLAMLACALAAGAIALLLARLLGRSR